MVQNEIKARLKFKALKAIHFRPQSTVLGFANIWHKIWSFCIYGGEQNEVESHFVLKNGLFSV